MDKLSIKVSKGISLEPIAQEYLNDIFVNFTPQVIKHLPLLKPSGKIEDTQKFIDSAKEAIKNNINYSWVILKNQKFIGCCGIREINTDIGDFGYWIKTEEQGKGIGKLIAKTVFDWSFKNCDIQKIKYPVDKRNIPSVKIIESLGGKIVSSYKTGQEDCLDVNEYHINKNSW
tara:strand:+ start:47 stop:565 length:519 start_codon:yes stop_codon:yes gene_type:complete